VQRHVISFAVGLALGWVGFEARDLVRALRASCGSYRNEYGFCAKHRGHLDVHQNHRGSWGDVT
jgi:hypothetical protein